jgi:hypothetical protein
VSWEDEVALYISMVNSKNHSQHGGQNQGRLDIDRLLPPYNLLKKLHLGISRNWSTVATFRWLKAVEDF